MAEPIPSHPFNCPKCGGQLNLYTPDETQAVACLHCGSVLDMRTENGKILATYHSKTVGKMKPQIPIGSRGHLRGEDVVVIGFLVKRIVVEGTTYRWSEYLLFNPTNGFRWLTEYQGHWNYVRTVTDIPRTIRRSSSGDVLEHRNLRYQHFQTARAKVDHVLGEFYWKVEVDEEALTQDYICPPFILSSERTGKELTWSLGLYVEPAEIIAAFKLKEPLAHRANVFANQPNLYKKYIGRQRFFAIAFCVAAVVLYSLLSGQAQKKRVHSEGFTYLAGEAERSRVSQLFRLEGRKSNARIDIATNLDNSWAFFGMALINLQTDAALDFGKEVSYYHGADSDGPWYEGRSWESIYVPSLEPGDYYLRIEPETNAASINYSLAVVRDVPRFAYLVWALILLILPWIYGEFRAHNFEMKRWAESDHPWAEEDDE